MITKGDEKRIRSMQRDKLERISLLALEISLALIEAETPEATFYGTAKLHTAQAKLQREIEGQDAGG